MAAADFRFAAPVWLSALAVLAAIIGWETDWGRQVVHVPQAPPPARTPPVSVALLPDFEIAGGAPARKDTVERPAFVPTRRPAPPAAAQEPPKPRIQRGQFVLTGTALVDKEAIAFLREAATGKSRTVRKGDNVNGLTVASIAPDNVVLALGDETEPLALKVAAGPRVTIQPPQPGAPAVAAPVPGQPPAPATVAQPAAGTQPAEAQSLLERRRAARAAQAAAEAAARAGAPDPNKPSAPAGATPPPATTAPAAPATGDNSWAEVYRRMQQPRR